VLPSVHDIRAALEATERFRIEEQIHEGMQALSFRAHNVAQNRTVFLKLIDYTPGNDEQSLREVRMLAETAETTTHASSSNLVRILDAEIMTLCGKLFVCIQTEFVVGSSVYAKVRLGPLGQQRAILNGCRILAGVSELHQLGLIHRDLKPANVMLSDVTGHPVIADLGSVATVGAQVLVRSWSKHSPLYTTPETWDHGEFSHATDVYQVGMLVYEMANGGLDIDDRHWLHVRDLGDLHRLGKREADLEDWEFSRLVNKGIARRAADQTLLAHGCAPMATMSASLARLLKRMTAPRPDQRPSVSEARNKLQGLALPNWLPVEEGVFEAQNWIQCDVRIVALRASVFQVEKRHASSERSFRKWSGSPHFADAGEAARWVEGQ